MTQEHKIDIRKLKSGTMLLIETEKAIYEIKVLNGRRLSVEIQGGNRFLRWTKATLNGSFGERNGSGEKELKKGCIHWGEGIDLSYEVNSVTNSVTTSTVITGKVTADDKSWSYDVWEDTKPDISQSVHEARSRLR